MRYEILKFSPQSFLNHHGLIKGVLFYDLRIFYFVVLEFIVNLQLLHQWIAQLCAVHLYCNNLNSIVRNFDIVYKLSYVCLQGEI